MIENFVIDTITIITITMIIIIIIIIIMKVKNDHRSKFSNLSNWKEEA